MFAKYKYFGEVTILILAIALINNHNQFVNFDKKVSTATNYTCNNTQVVDFIIVQEIKQEERNFKLKEYQTLEAKGILTAHDVQQETTDLQLLIKYDKRLHNNLICLLKP